MTVAAEKVVLLGTPLTEEITGMGILLGKLRYCHDQTSSPEWRRTIERREFSAMLKKD
jgi:hypothetical protein